MQKSKLFDFSNVHVYIVEFVHQNGYTEFHHIFGTSITDARRRALILKKFIYRGIIPLCKIRTIVYRQKF